ncbi:MAG: hypothetical protein WCX46_02930 [Candidatus Paceibacterota bacterium]
MDILKIIEITADIVTVLSILSALAAYFYGKKEKIEKIKDQEEYHV